MVDKTSIRGAEYYQRRLTGEERNRCPSQCTERVRTVAVIFDAEGSMRLEYFWGKQYPIGQSNGFMSGIDGILSKKGWKKGGVCTSYKENVSAMEILRGMALTDAYEAVFDELMPPGSARSAGGLTEGVFMKHVDKKFDETKILWEDRYPDIKTVEELIAILLSSGFKLISTL